MHRTFMSRFLLAVLLLGPLSLAHAQDGDTAAQAADDTAGLALDDAIAQADAAPAQTEVGAEALPVEPQAAAAAPPTTAAQDAPTNTPPPADAAATTRTQAEDDYNALYGPPAGEYDPIADPTLPAPAELPAVYDPWEKLNRRTHAFNNVVDRAIAKPLAKAYVKVTPRPVRLGVSNFFNNLGQPVSALNALLQGKPKQAGQSFGRFVVNSTIGLAGFFDPATKFRIPNKSEDLGQTLGVWGWRQSRYVELPLFGPRTVRDVFGLVGDGQLSPIRQIEEDKVRVFIQGLQLVDVRTQLLAIDSLREGATDEYALFRDSWLQRRNYQIFGDRQKQPGDPDDGLPDYLLDEEANPTVPADAMPIIPGAGAP
jgi:phospholipid-binding lipoprotein MlaA